MMFFKNIDNFLFKQIDQLKSSQFFSKVSDTLALLDDETRSGLNQLLTLILVIFPFLVICLVYLSNYNAKNEIALRQEMIQMSNKIIGEQKEIQNKRRTLYSKAPLNTPGALKSKMSSIASSLGLNSSKIHTKKFQVDSSIEGIVKADFEIELKEFSTKDLMQFVRIAVQREKVVIQAINITKNKKSTIDAIIELSHFAKATGT